MLKILLKVSKTLWQTFKILTARFDPDWPYVLTSVFVNLFEITSTKVLLRTKKTGKNIVSFYFGIFFKSELTLISIGIPLSISLKLICQKSLKIGFSLTENRFPSLKTGKPDSKIFFVKLFCFIWHLTYSIPDEKMLTTSFQWLKLPREIHHKNHFRSMISINSKVKSSHQP